MKAELVYNNKGEPRILLEFETEAEREVFKDGPTLSALVQGTDADTGMLLDWAYEVVNE